MSLMSVPPIPAELADEPEWAGELDEAVLAGAVLPEVAAKYVPSSRREAEWPMRKLAALTARARQVSDEAADWRSRIDEWEASELKRVSGGVEYFTHLLERFAVAYRRENPKEATIRLPSGEIGTTVPKTPKVKIDDEPAVLAWLAENLDGERYEKVVKTVESVKVSELAKVGSVQKRLVPYCEVCGLALDKDGAHTRPPLQDDCTPGPGWIHPDDEFDHDPQPGSMWEVLIDGQPVPGVSASLGDVSASVRPAR